jgi:hypothetical protein
VFPSSQPTCVPSVIPSGQPSSSPSASPTSYPSVIPSCSPTSGPTRIPTRQPTSRPTHCPSGRPSFQPISVPTSFPSIIPNGQPSTLPTTQPSGFPSVQTTSLPSCQPTVRPTGLPSDCPTSQPSSVPSNVPTSDPSGLPSSFPSSQPSLVPSTQPSTVPSNQPSSIPSVFPSSQPTCVPSVIPSGQPSSSPRVKPTSCPSGIPSCSPTSRPTTQPSSSPSVFPSVKPTRIPTRQPTSRPTHCPSGRPSSQPIAVSLLQPVVNKPSDRPATSSLTLVPTRQPFLLSNSSAIRPTKGIIFFPGNAIYNNEILAKTNELLGSSYILLGRKLNAGQFPDILDLEITKSFVSLINDNISGIIRDSVTKSTTVLGDINKDGFLDLLIGFPLESKCLVYLGNSRGFFDRESFNIVGDFEQGSGQLGWASTRVGDLNRDGFDDIVVSAPYANTIYVINGRVDFHEDIVVSELKLKDGFKVYGSVQDINFGVAMTAVHDFNNDGLQDLAVTAVRAGGANVIYVILGAASFGQRDIHIDQLNITSCLRIFAPYLSFAGFSIAGIGDINGDGYGDLAIGSIPIRNARYVEQKCYIVYGRRSVTQTELFLSEMTSKDGFIVTGAGFLVQSAGDVNADGIPDVMLTSYYDWKGKGNSYLVTCSVNVTNSPTLEPSSFPSSLPSTAPSAVPSSSFPSISPSAVFQTTFFPTSANSSSTLSPQRALTRTPTAKVTVKPSRLPSFRPSRSSGPTFLPTRLPAWEPTPVPTSIRLPPTAQPVTTTTTTTTTTTPLPTNSQFLRSRIPTTLSTASVSNEIEIAAVNSTDFTEVICKLPGVYSGQNKTNFRFVVNANSGTVTVTGAEYNGARNVYILSSCPSERVDLVITNFRLSTDVISVAHLQNFGYSYDYPNEISYFAKDGKNQPLTLLFCPESKLQLILLSHTSFDLKESNFFFVRSDNSGSKKENASVLAQAEIGIAFAVIGILYLIFYCLFYQNTLEEQEQLKREQQLDTMILDLEEETVIVDIWNQTNQEVLDDSNHEIGVKSSSSHDDNSWYEGEDDNSNEDKLNNGSDRGLSSMNSDEWLEFVALSDNDEPVEKVTNYLSTSESDENLETTAPFPDILKREQLLQSLDTATPTNGADLEEETQMVIADIPVKSSTDSCSLSSSNEGMNESSNDDKLNSGSDRSHISGIMSDEWLEALALSDSEEPVEKVTNYLSISESDENLEITTAAVLDSLDNSNILAISFLSPNRDDESELPSLNSDNSAFRE